MARQRRDPLTGLRGNQTGGATPTNAVSIQVVSSCEPLYTLLFSGSKPSRPWWLFLDFLNDCHIGELKWLFDLTVNNRLCAGQTLNTTSNIIHQYVLGHSGTGLMDQLPALTEVAVGRLWGRITKLYQHFSPEGIYEHMLTVVPVTFNETVNHFRDFTHHLSMSLNPPGSTQWVRFYISLGRLNYIELQDLNLHLQSCDTSLVTAYESIAAFTAIASAVDSFATHRKLTDPDWVDLDVKHRQSPEELINTIQIMRDWMALSDTIPYATAHPRCLSYEREYTEQMAHTATLLQTMIEAIPAEGQAVISMLTEEEYDEYWFPLLSFIGNDLTDSELMWLAEVLQCYASNETLQNIAYVIKHHINFMYVRGDYHERVSISEAEQDDVVQELCAVLRIEYVATTVNNRQRFNNMMAVNQLDLIARTSAVLNRRQAIPWIYIHSSLAGLSRSDLITLRNGCDMYLQQEVAEHIPGIVYMTTRLVAEYILKYCNSRMNIDEVAVQRTTIHHTEFEELLTVITEGFINGVDDAFSAGVAEDMLHLAGLENVLPDVDSTFLPDPTEWAWFLYRLGRLSDVQLVWLYSLTENSAMGEAQRQLPLISVIRTYVQSQPQDLTSIDEAQLSGIADLRRESIFLRLFHPFEECSEARFERPSGPTQYRDARDCALVLIRFAECLWHDLLPLQHEFVIGVSVLLGRRDNFTTEWFYAYLRSHVVDGQSAKLEFLKTFAQAYTLMMQHDESIGVRDAPHWPQTREYAYIEDLIACLTSRRKHPRTGVQMNSTVVSASPLDAVGTRLLAVLVAVQDTVENSFELTWRRTAIEGDLTFMDHEELNTFWIMLRADYNTALTYNFSSIARRLYMELIAMVGQHVVRIRTQAPQSFELKLLPEGDQFRRTVLQKYTANFMDRAPRLSQDMPRLDNVLGATIAHDGTEDRDFDLD